jgi:hypothetical protein
MAGVLISTYLAYFIVTLLGHLEDFFGKIFFPKAYQHLRMQNVNLIKKYLSPLGICPIDERF